MDVIVDRCAGLDVHKKTVMATVRWPDGRGGRAQETREYQTFTNRLVELRDWLVAEGASASSSGRCTVPVMMTGACDHHRPLESPGCQARRCRCPNARRSPSR
jgi:hypothetical protein